MDLMWVPRPVPRTLFMLHFRIRPSTDQCTSPAQRVSYYFPVIASPQHERCLLEIRALKEKVEGPGVGEGKSLRGLQELPLDIVYEDAHLLVLNKVILPAIPDVFGASIGRNLAILPCRLCPALPLLGMGR